MDDGRLFRLLRALRVDVRAGEVRAALALFLYFFLVTFAFYIIKSVKESLQIEVNQRNWWGFDLGTAVLIGFVVALNARLLNRLARRSYSSLTLAFFAACLFLFSFIFYLTVAKRFSLSPLLPLVQQHKSVFVFAFSFWSDIFIAMSVTQFWIAVNDIFFPHQAKRLIGFLVTGGLLGGIGGSLFTWVLSPRVGPHNLLLACPVVLLLIAVAVNVVHAERERLRGGTEAELHLAGRGVGYLESLRTVRGDPYLRILAGVLASAVLAGQFINYQFKFVIKAQNWDADMRAAKLGLFFLAVLILSTVFHLATTGKVLRLFKIPRALLLAPLLLLAGTAPVFFLTVVVAKTALPTLGGRLWAFGLRGTDKVFDNTLSQSVRELLYVPIPAEIKYKAKVFIDMFVNKFALGFGAILYLVIYRAAAFGSWNAEDYEFQVRTLGFVVILFALVWTALVWIIHSRYLEAVGQGVKRKREDAEKTVRQNVDIDLTRLIIDTIQSREKNPTLYVMNLFQLMQNEKLTAAQRESVGQGADELKARSMDALLDVGGESFFQGIEATVSAKDFEVIIREIMALPAYKELMEATLGKIIVGGPKGSDDERMMAAKLMGFMEPTPNVIRDLGRMLQDPSPDVLYYALGSARAHLRKEHVPFLIDLLGNPMLRQDAQGALAAYGPRIEDALRKRLHDQAGPADVRKAIPEVLARFANQRAADILMAELARSDEGLEQELVEALYKVRAERPDIHFHAKDVRAAVLSLFRKSYEDYLGGEVKGPAGRPAPPGPERAAAVDLRTKRTFDLLTLIYPAETIVRAYQNIRHGEGRSADHAIELLENTLDRELMAFLSPLIEDLPPDERLRRLRKLARGLGARPA